MSMDAVETDAAEPIPLARLQESNPARWGKPGTWRCEAHDVTTAGDCPVCDEELIALHEESLPKCHACGRVLREGEEAWAADWTVIGSTGAHTETRYTCDGCS